MSATIRPLDVDQRLIKAIAHPLRFRLLSAFDEAECSPNQLAQLFDEPLGRVSHHVRVLAELRAIELVRTEPRRGAVEHFYRAVVRPWFDDAAWRRLPRTTRRALFGQNLARILGDASAAAQAEGFDDPRAHVSYTLLDLDEEGMDAVAHVLEDALERIVAIQEAATARIEGAPAAMTELAMLHFTRP